MTERRYQMTRLGAGDYLLPSNDRETLWRIERYEDGRAWGLEVDYETRPFWRLWRYRGDVHALQPDDFDGIPSDRWEYVVEWRPTRQACIDYAMEHATTVSR